MSIIPFLDAGLQILDKVIPDPEKRQEAKAKLIELQQRGEMEKIEAQLSAIIAEAKSDDPWTSRARPTFLYTMYAYILAGIPVGIAYTLNPDAAGQFAVGVGQWLSSIPDELYWLFGAGYLGYTGARSFDKRKPFK